MGSVLIARTTAFCWTKAMDSPTSIGKVSNTPATRFRIGSLTKQFTAVCILLLEERGKLRLDDPIKNYLPDAPAAWEKITFFHLLTHSSGIPDLLAFPEIAVAQQNPATPAELVAYFRDKPLEFQPGSNTRYSNSGFILLGYLIEKISGQSYAEFLQKNIFDPLGMADTGYDSTAVCDRPSRPRLRHRPAGIRPGCLYRHDQTFLGGGLYSTTHDLLHWQRQLYEGKLLQPASLKKMTTPTKHGPGLGIGVGFKPRKAYLYEGRIAGFASHLAYYPETKTSVIVLGNLDDDVGRATSSPNSPPWRSAKPWSCRRSGRPSRCPRRNSPNTPVIIRSRRRSR